MLPRTKSSAGPMGPGCLQAKAWVKMHYERNEEGVVAKSVMYCHYDEFCREQNKNTMETSIFGRVVKSVFPDVSIRRLGGRDNLKYYYCGIQAKETSPYAIDNTTTTRPKRRLRKRENIADSEDVQRCLRWLLATYEANQESAVVKADSYEKYLCECSQMSSETLSLQHFGLVLSHAFPHVTKRKLRLRSNHQKLYFGIKERPTPLPLESIPNDVLSISEGMLRNGRLKGYRETEPEEEDDFSCKSQASEDSDISSPSQDMQSVSGDCDLYPPVSQCNEYSLNIKDEPVDYSLSSLQLKDEPYDESLTVKEEEPLDLQVNLHSRSTPEMPSSIGTYSNGSSPSSPSKDGKSKKIYKPRFHFDYNDESSWNTASDSNMDNKLITSSFQCHYDLFLRRWLEENVESVHSVYLNRDQLYTFYKKHCSDSETVALTLAHFDATVLKLYSGVVTVIHPSGKVFYEGVLIRVTSPLFNIIEHIDGNAKYWQSNHQTDHMSQSILSPEDSPLSYSQDDDQFENSGSNFPTKYSMSTESQQEVLKDGKYYLRKWLIDNFESVPDSCVLKAEAYRHYEHFAKSINQTPFEMNVFGKIVRIVFPDVSIRRLGGRAKPQYHYCGIAAKKSSILYQYMSGKDPAQRSRKKEIATDNRSAEIVIEWLKHNYEPGKDKIIMKSEVYSSFTVYCNSINETPVTLNYFGKLVKHCFPNVEVRKFGGRSEPTWYYYGLVPRDSVSNRYHIMSDEVRPGVERVQYHSGASLHRRSTTPDRLVHEGSPMFGSHPIPIPNFSPRSTLGSPSPASYNSPPVLSPSFLVHAPLGLSPHSRPSRDPDSYSDAQFGSSPGINRAFAAASISSPYDRPALQAVGRTVIQHSPLESSELMHSDITSHSPVDKSGMCHSPHFVISHHHSSSPVESPLIFSRSPIDHHLKHSPLHNPMVHISVGAQVVPSQTPPGNPRFTHNQFLISSGHSSLPKRPKTHTADFEPIVEMQLE